MYPTLYAYSMKVNIIEILILYDNVGFDLILTTVSGFELISKTGSRSDFNTRIRNPALSGV